MLYDIESTSCSHCVYLLSCLHRSHHRHRNIVRYRINIVLTLCISLILFTSITSSTSQCCTISNQHCVDIVYLLSCLHRSHHRHRKVLRYRINIVSTLCTSYPVYTFHIVDIAMLYDIESTLCRHCVSLILFTSFTSSTSQCCTISNQHRVYLLSCLHLSHHRHHNIVRYWINIVLTVCISLILFTSITSSTSQRCTISNQHRVHIVYLLSCLHRSHRRHHNVVRYRINIVSTLCISYPVYIDHIIDIATLYDIESTSCWHCVYLLSCLHRSHHRHRNVVWYRINIVLTFCISLIRLTLITSSTSQRCTISNQHRVHIVYFLSCLHHR